MSDPGRRWTTAQQRAIEARGRTLVAAAAGSGKTSVLTELVIRALVAREVAPSEVCAVTFTEKSAQEMRTRIAGGLVARGELELAAELELARIGTIHSLCAAIVRRHGASIGVDPGAGVLDEAQAAFLRRRALDEILAHAADDPDALWARGLVGDDAIRSVLSGIERCLDHGSDPAPCLVDVVDMQLPVDETGQLLVSRRDAERFHDVIRRLVIRHEETAGALRARAGRLRFDDLERLAARAVRVPSVRADLRARWTLVLVDEFQDTNERQFELLDAIGGDRLFMVGDEWQSIYRFRGADVDVFRARRTDPSSDLIQMRENFRSSGPVLDVVNRIFGHDALFGAGYEPVIAGTDEQRSLVGPAVELLVVPDDATHASAHAGPSGRMREARRVAERIAQLIESGAASPGDIAVLYAASSGAAAYEQALAEWGIPVLRGASTGFYDQRDVRDVLAMLAVLRNASDDHAMLNVLAGPYASLEWHELDQLATMVRSERCTLFEAARASDIERAVATTRLIDELRSELEHGSLVSLVARITSLERIELGCALQRDGVLRLANLRRLVELAASATQIGVSNVAGFLEFVDAQRIDARVGEASLADEQAGAVRLMTIHASKGLEFEHVFVVEAAAQERRGELVPVPRRCDQGNVHIPVPSDDGRLHRTPRLTRLLSDDDARAAQERHRLWYVALTRARHALYISGRWRFEATKSGAPRSMPSALGWLHQTMDLPPFFGGPDGRRIAFDGAVVVDTHTATRRPREIVAPMHEITRYVAPPQMPDRPSARTDRGGLVEGTPRPRALRELLRASITTNDDRSRRDAGTRMHDALSQIIAASSSPDEAHRCLASSTWGSLHPVERSLVSDVIDASVFAQLLEHDARVEVPYVAGFGERVESRLVPGIAVAADVAQIDAGRLDALVTLADGSWWIVDWKSTLPTHQSDAFERHRSQLQRYADAAYTLGARDVRVSLVALDRPRQPASWRIGRDRSAEPISLDICVSDAPTTDAATGSALR